MTLKSGILDSACCTDEQQQCGERPNIEVLAGALAKQQVQRRGGSGSVADRSSSTRRGSRGLLLRKASGTSIRSSTANGFAKAPVPTIWLRRRRCWRTVLARLGGCTSTGGLLRRPASDSLSRVGICAGLTGMSGRLDTVPVYWRIAAAASTSRDAGAIRQRQAGQGLESGHRESGVGVGAAHFESCSTGMARPGGLPVA
jgi:hypothetical protein